MKLKIYFISSFGLNLFEYIVRICVYNLPINFFSQNDPIAQSVRALVCKREIVGSSPAVDKNKCIFRYVVIPQTCASITDRGTLNPIDFKLGTLIHISV